MTVTIRRWAEDECWIISKDEDFLFVFGSLYTVKQKDLFKAMDIIADYANNKAGKECLFEVG